MTKEEKESLDSYVRDRYDDRIAKGRAVAELVREVSE